MTRTAAVLLIGMLVGACGGSGTNATSTNSTGATPTTSAPAVTPQTTGPTEPNRDSAPTTAATDPTQPVATQPDTGDASPADPDYDVFIAAIADAVIGTRFEEAPYQEPEVVVSTGLLMCERLAAGFTSDEVTLEYLTELAGGDPADADDDQLVLTGALLGAAEVALCPPTDDR